MVAGLGFSLGGGRALGGRLGGRALLRARLPGIRQSFMPSFRMQGMIFFERGAIKKNISRLLKVPDSPLRKAAFLIRKIAEQSIRKTPKFGNQSRRLSKSKFRLGTLNPPKSRAPGHPMRRIGASPTDFFATQWIIGSEYLGSIPPVPGLHEHGGSARRRVIIGSIPVKGPSGRFMGRRPLFSPNLVTVRYPKRAFMKPALKIAQFRLAPLWRNSIKER